MSYFDKHPKQFRILFGVLAAYLLYIASSNFYRISTVPTDENLFTAPPSRLYVTKAFPGNPIEIQNSQQKIGVYYPDSIQVVEFLVGSGSADSVTVGDFVYGIDGRKVKDLERFNRVLQSIDEDSSFVLNLLRMSAKNRISMEVKKSALPDDFVRQIPPSAFVIQVNTGGASDRAGMQVGDLIVRINGKSFSDIWEADRIMRSARAGKTVDYDIIRDNKIVTLHVTLASFGFPIVVLLQFLMGIVYSGMALFIAMNCAGKNSARLMGMAFLLFGMALALSMGHVKMKFDEFAITRYVTFNICLVFGLAFWLESAYFFPKEWTEIVKKKWIRMLPFIAATGFSIYMIISFFVNYRIVHEQGIIIIIFSAILYNFLIHLFFRKKRPPELRKLSRVIAWTIYGIFLFFVLILVKPLHLQKVEGINYSVLLFVLIPLAYIYTIGRYKILDLKLGIRKNVQHSIVSSAWVVALVVIFIKVLSELPSIAIQIPNFRLTITSFEIIDEPLPAGHQAFLEKLFLMIAAIALTVVFWKIRGWGQKIIDKKYYHSQFDYGKSANALAEVMATKLTITDLAKGITQKLTELMHLKNAGIVFFRDEDTCCYQAAFGFDGIESKEFIIDIRQQFIHVLQKIRTDSRFSVDYLPPDLKSNFEANGFRHIVPIWFKEKLVGTLLIGEKLSEAPIHAEDLTFFTTVAKQASVAIENAFLHEEITEQERLKHELMIARRIQLASLPQSTPEIEGLEISGTSIPATEVGGDYFDYLNGAPGTVTVIVGDVSGKGTSAALYLFKIQGILRSLYEFGLKPRDLFIRANQLLYKDLEKQAFVTAISGLFDVGQRRLVLARAGHLPLFYYQAETQTVQVVAPRGLGLGLDGEKIFISEIEEKVIDYNAGDVFLFVTDGITEAQSKEKFLFGEDSLVNVLKSCNSKNAIEIRDHIINTVRNFSSDMSQQDDQTVVVVKAV